MRPSREVRNDMSELECFIRGKCWLQVWTTFKGMLFISIRLLLENILFHLLKNP